MRATLSIPFLLFLVVFTTQVNAQRVIKGATDRIGTIAGGGTGGSTQDSLQSRDHLEDSITIQFYFADTTRPYKFDSSINEYNVRFPIPATYHFLGNPGTAATSMLFQAGQRAGFDHGFHGFDLYKWELSKARFFNTTRPYTELGYTLGSQTQQIIELLHTQNYKPYWNFSLQYRLINSPGFFKNQKTAHNNYQVTSWYNSPNKRYNNYVVIIGNKLQAAENGGVLNPRHLRDRDFDDRFSVPTKLGVQNDFTRNFFDAQITTGNKYREFNFQLKQQYDLGKKDSIVTDSLVIPLFFPRLRFEHSLKYATYRHQFVDAEADTPYYKITYGLNLLSPPDTIEYRDDWREWSNDFSIYQYPDAKNLHQFFKVGVELQLLTRLRNASGNFSNVIGHGEYRNRTRNKKWDMLASGRLWMNGFNGGDYHAFVTLQRSISNKIGSLLAGFENINRSPSFTFDERSEFYLDQAKSFKKENTTHFFGGLDNPALKLKLSADYYLVTNYMYVRDFYKLEQQNDLFSFLRINALKTIHLGGQWNWYAELYLQQKAGNANVNLPLILTRNRIVYEGNFGYKNLSLAMGAEVRYHTPYKMDHYSPVLGRFTYQDTLRIPNRPDVHAFLNFRIRSFRAYARIENLNTIRIDKGVQFKRHNLAAPNYPYPGMVVRLGIFWSFVN